MLGSGQRLSGREPGNRPGLAAFVLDSTDRKREPTPMTSKQEILAQWLRDVHALEEQAKTRAKVRAEAAARFDTSGLRERLLARRASQTAT